MFIIAIFVLVGSKSFLGTLGEVGELDSGVKVEQTTDGAYIVIGYGTYGDGGVLLSKFHTNGSFHWGLIVQGYTDSPSSVQQTNDGGYIITGATYEYGNAGGYDFFLGKFDSDGSLAWYKSHGGNDLDWPKHVVQTNDDGYIVTGYSTSWELNDDIILAKFNSDGVLEWLVDIGEEMTNDGGYSVSQTADGGFVVAGDTGFGGIGYQDLFLAHFNSSGGIEWFKAFGGNMFDSAGDMDVSEEDGSVFVVGSTDSFGAGSTFGKRDILIAKFQSNGTLIFARTLGGIFGHDLGRSVTHTSDGGCIVTGVCESMGNGNGDVLLAKLDSEGSVEWVRLTGSDENDVGNSVIERIEGGYVVVGAFGKPLLNNNLFLSLVPESGAGCQWSDYTDQFISYDITDSIKVENVENVVSKRISGVQSYSHSPTIITVDTPNLVTMCESVFECYGIDDYDISNVCSGHGDCVDDEECACSDEEIYSGDECDLWRCYGNLNKDTRNVCSAHGVCIDYNNCSCSDSYDLDGECDYSCFDISSKDTTRVCGNGVCIDIDICECFPGYYEKNDSLCESWSCFGYDRDDSQVCSSKKGICAAPNLCKCLNDYEGEDCESWSCGGDDYRLPTTCDGNGECLKPSKCKCKGGFSGKNCKTNDLLLYAMTPVLSLSGLAFSMFLLIFCCCVCCCGCVCLIIICISFCGVGCLSLMNRTQKTKMKKFSKLRNVDLLIREQELEEDTSIAHLSINQKLFEIDFEDVSLIRIIGQGGSNSTVYEAKWHDQVVAFKCFRTSAVCQSQDSFDEFEKEVSILGSVSHPHILDFYGCSLKPPRVGILMEFCENGDLEYFLKLHKTLNSKSLEFTEKLRTCIEIILPLSYLHSKKIIHRDLKLENVLIDKANRCKLMDFGISKIVDRMSQTKTANIGTCYFMAPELILSAGIYDEKVDVFAFGITAYVILTERFRPYGTDNYGIEIRVANNPDVRPDLSFLKSSVPYEHFDWLKKVIQECWQDDPQERPSFKKLSTLFQEKKLICDSEKSTMNYDNIEVEEESEGLLSEKSSVHSFLGKKKSSDKPTMKNENEGVKKGGNGLQYYKDRVGVLEKEKKKMERQIDNFKSKVETLEKENERLKHSSSSTKSENERSIKQQLPNQRTLMNRPTKNRGTKSENERLKRSNSTLNRPTKRENERLKRSNSAFNRSHSTKRENEQKFKRSRRPPPPPRPGSRGPLTKKKIIL